MVKKMKLFQFQYQKKVLKTFKSKKKLIIIKKGDHSFLIKLI